MEVSFSDPSTVFGKGTGRQHSFRTAYTNKGCISFFLSSIFPSLQTQKLALSHRFSVTLKLLLYVKTHVFIPQGNSITWTFFTGFSSWRAKPRESNSVCADVLNSLHMTRRGITAFLKIQRAILTTAKQNQSFWWKKQSEAALAATAPSTSSVISKFEEERSPGINFSTTKYNQCQLVFGMVVSQRRRNWFKSV